MKAALLLREAGAEPQAMRYVAFDGGGEALAGVIGGAIKVYPGDIAEMAFAEAHGSEAHRKVHAEKGLLPLALSGEAFEAAVRQQAEELRTLAEETGIIATTN
jgi:tripartite-type tricarboxylate transporter receptor subunit TctC